MKGEAKTSSSSQALLWFGAAVSISEIMTGAMIAPLGLGKGIAAILLGHLIGCVLLYLVGYIGAREERSAIASTRLAFGTYGSYLFSLLNILQLTGWTAVMILNGAKATDLITRQAAGYANEALWSVLIGALIAVWIIIGIKQLSKVNTVVMSALLVLTVVLGVTVFGGGAQSEAISGTEGISFGAAVELGVVMPLSWIPLISDYTKDVRQKRLGTLASAVGYFVGSCLMYIIGLGAALYTGTADIAQIMLAAGMPAAALVIVVLSTVTTTFLDAYSAGVSAANLSARVREKAVALAVCVVGVLLAIFVSMNRYEAFLSLIGSVFAPLFAISVTDYYILKHRTDAGKRAQYGNLIIWAAGVVAYHLLASYSTPLGISLPVMIGTGFACVITEGVKKKWSR